MNLFARLLVDNQICGCLTRARIVCRNAREHGRVGDRDSRDFESTPASAVGSLVVWVINDGRVVLEPLCRRLGRSFDDALKDEGFAFGRFGAFEVAQELWRFSLDHWNDLMSRSASRDFLDTLDDQNILIDLVDHRDGIFFGLQVLHRVDNVGLHLLK